MEVSVSGDQVTLACVGSEAPVMARLVTGTGVLITRWPVAH